MPRLTCLHVLLNVLWLAVLSLGGEEVVYSDEYRLGSALDAVLGSLRSKRPTSHESNLESSISRRCKDYLTCESPIPGVEVKNVLFEKGQMHISGSKERLSDEMTDMMTFYGALKGKLPSTLVQIGRVTDWVGGPNIVKSDKFATFCTGRASKKDVHNRTHALFLFPWEAHNTFHALNDNVLSVLANVIAHYLHTPADISAHKLPRYSLYTFIGTTPPTLMYDLLPLIFGSSYVQPVSALFTGPTCVYSLSWVSALKPFYKDTLIDMRRACYDVLQHILRSYNASLPVSMTDPDTALQQPRRLSSATEKETLVEMGRQLATLRPHRQGRLVAPGTPRKSARPTVTTTTTTLKTSTKSKDSTPTALANGAYHISPYIPGGPRLIIVTRMGGNDPSRKLSPKAELSLLQAYSALGFNVEICCDFKIVRTIPQLLAHFLGVDVCVGIHGAGLANCIFGNPGLTVVELATHHGYGSLLFHKIAHMAGGQHLFYDLRNIEKMKGVRDEGFELGTTLIRDLTQLTLRLHQYARTQQPQAQLQSADQATSTSFWPIFTGSSRNSKEASMVAASFTPNEVLVVCPAEHTVYTNTPTSAGTAAGVRQLLGGAPTTTTTTSISTALTTTTTTVSASSGAAAAAAGTYTLQPLSAWLPLKGVKDERKMTGRAYTIATIKRNQGTYWIQMSPTPLVPYTVESILGPKLGEVDEQCRRLQYLQFRKMTLSPNDTAIRDCDKHSIVRKRTGTRDHSLMQLIQ